MKKILTKAVCLIAALAIVFTLIPGQASAANDLTFLCINDTFIYSLSSGNMPLRMNGSMYISYRYLMRIKPIKYFYDSDSRILKVYNSSKQLIFDIGSGITYDQDGKIYAFLAEIRGGVIFVPIEFICRVFGVEYSVIQTEYGPVIRISSVVSPYSDGELIANNKETIENIYQRYVASLEPENNDAPQTEPEPEETKNVYLAVCGELNEHTERLFAAMSTYGVKATFFLSGDLASQGDLLRRIISEGHELGAYVSAEDPVGEAERINELLSSLVFRKTRLICVDQGSRQLAGEQLEEIAAAGFRLWDASLDPGSDVSNGYTISANTTNLLKKALRTSVLKLMSTAGAGDAAYTVMRNLKNGSYNLLTMHEWTTPVNGAGFYK
ncbi:MAG: polysaccharide deacetylase family protein [Clostridia bacterium]|nr:polysaccharide deacetylase family protein [Clostridia bacterium]